MVTQLFLVAALAGGSTPPVDLLANLREVLRYPTRRDMLADQLYPLGFSRHGLFAYLTIPADEAVGQYLWELVILDLVKDEKVDGLRWQQDSDTPIKDMRSLIAVQGSGFRGLLAQYEIEPLTDRRLLALPVRYQGATYTAKVEKPEETGDPQGDLTRSYPVTLVDPKSRRKELGRIEARRREGLDNTFPPTLAGYIPSPFEPRVVLVLGQQVRGYEGPPSVMTFKITGAHLTAGFDKKPAPGLAEQVRRVWADLGKSANRCPDDYDYFPQGGLRNFACHLWSFGTYADLAALSGMQVFSKGPHSNRKLALTSKRDFGRYNPEFVRWLVDHVIPGSEDVALREATQAVYDANIKPLAAVFYLTYRKLRANPECMVREKQRYADLLARGGVPDGDYERYFFFLNDNFCTHPQSTSQEDFQFYMDHGFDGGRDGNVVKTCTAFWLRRAIDGTDGEFFRGLEKMLRAYDPGQLQQTRN